MEPTSIFNALLLINIASMFYYALSFIPLLESEIEKGLKRRTEVRSDAENSSEIVEAYNVMIDDFLWARKYLMWPLLLILMIPLLLLFVLIVFQSALRYELTLNYTWLGIWALLLFIELLVTVGVVIYGMRKRPTLRYLEWKNKTVKNSPK